MPGNCGIARRIDKPVRTNRHIAPSRCYVEFHDSTVVHPRGSKDRAQYERHTRARQCPLRPTPAKRLIVLKDDGVQRTPRMDRADTMKVVQHIVDRAESDTMRPWPVRIQPAYGAQQCANELAPDCRHSIQKDGTLSQLSRGKRRHYPGSAGPNDANINVQRHPIPRLRYDAGCKVEGHGIYSTEMPRAFTSAIDFSASLLTNSRNSGRVMLRNWKPRSRNRLVTCGCFIA